MSGQQEPYVEKIATPSDGSQPEDQTLSTAEASVKNARNEQNVSGQQPPQNQDSSESMPGSQRSNS